MDRAIAETGRSGSCDRPIASAGSPRDNMKNRAARAGFNEGNLLAVEREERVRSKPFPQRQC